MTIHNWVHKADLQLELGRNSDHIAVDEAVIRLNDEQYWLDAAVNLESNELLHTKLEPTGTKVIASDFVRELREEHDVNDAVFLISRDISLQYVCERHDLEFRYERHGGQNSTKHVFREIKRRTTTFSNCFSNTKGTTVDQWLEVRVRMKPAYLNTTVSCNPRLTSQ
ncbi:Transposase (plasmid) [Natrarchaeobaculum sulfurireducens]|uniref:Transposase n=1 Tax=Natrarchaeobaculum sulfurireducens TaxID=2044521 RepID=A0A346PJZ4_9EURY|nr:IS6 family transposase [Natrarchaeobaculum sulfurireducens]AXR79839.1 Transposase [Natrarchaeobaculum sulfurireducens]